MDISIELVSGETLASKAPYKINTLELVELKLHLKVMLYKGYARPIVSPCGASVSFIRKKDNTLKL